MKYKKIDKEFLLTDSSLNSYSYRLLTSGYDLSAFKKNPIGYYMHGTKEHPREQGVLVKWEDLRMEGDKVYGTPCINLSHPRGQRTVDEIESGFLNAASVGHIVAVAISSDAKDYLPDQKGPTIIKWFNREASLVDIPGNYNALTDLVDENDVPINLADFNIKNLNMKQIILTAAQLALIPNLKADASQTDVDGALSDLVAKAAKVDQLTSDLAAANTGKTKAETDLANFKKTTVENQVKDLADNAVAEGRCTKEAGEQLKKDYATNPEGLKSLVATMKPYESVVDKTKAATGSKRLADLVAMDYEKLDKEGLVEELKALSMDDFKTKYKAYTGADYTGK